MNGSLAIGIDLGGTNLKVAVVDRQGRIAAQQVGPTNAERGPQPIIEDMAALANLVLRDASSCGDCAGVGVGSPGPLSLRTGRVIRSANLPGWEDMPLRDLLAQRLSLPVILENDANAAAYGEFWMGAGRDGADMVMLTLGTGVGSGVILDGRLVHGHFENAGELGHMIVVPDGLPCGCGQRGCLEAYASATSVTRRVIAAMEEGKRQEAKGAILTPTSLRPGAGPLREASRVPSSLAWDASTIADRARQGDPLCSRVWSEACIYLAIACISIQHAFNPARVILGGGMAQAGAFLRDNVIQELHRRQWSLHSDLPAIVLAELGPDAGVIGAAGLVFANCHESW